MPEPTREQLVAAARCLRNRAESNERARDEHAERRANTYRTVARYLERLAYPPAEKVDLKDLLNCLISSLEHLRPHWAEGCCMCGDIEAAHGMGSGHSYTDMGEYTIGQAVAEAKDFVSRQG